jgi:hypothetical protein
MTSQYELVIIGFGVSGVAMARAAQKKGIKYIVLEASSNCGGVWNNAFDTSRLQTHWKNYRFSDYNKKYESNFPFSREILEYIREYTYQNSFNVKYNSRVINCNYNSSPSNWQIKYKLRGVTVNITSKFLAVCSGYYSVPREIPGLSNFTGEVIKYNKYSKIGLKNKKILIVGNGASCIDVLKHWTESGIYDEIGSLDISYNTDKYFLNTYFARFISLFVNKYFLKFLRYIPHWSLIIIISLFCKFNGHIPDIKFTADNVVASGVIIDFERNGEIRYIKSQLACALGNRVLFANGTVGEYDVIINKCGYRKNIDFLNINVIDEELGYNFAIIDRFPQCAFIGFAPSANWTRVSEAQANWWSNVVTGKLNMPNKVESESFLKKYKKTGGDTRRFNDLTYESLEFAESLLKKN